MRNHPNRSRCIQHSHLAYCCCQFHFENKCLINSFDVQKKAFHLRWRSDDEDTRTSSVRPDCTHNRRWYLSLTDHRRLLANPTTDLSQMCGVQHRVDTRRNTISTMWGSTCCHDVAYDYYLVRLSSGACEKYTHTHHTHLTQCIPRQITNNEVIKRYGREPFACRVPTVTRSQHSSHPKCTRAAANRWRSHTHERDFSYSLHTFAIRFCDAVDSLAHTIFSIFTIISLFCFMFRFLARCSTNYIGCMRCVSDVRCAMCVHRYTTVAKMYFIFLCQQQ